MNEFSPIGGSTLLLPEPPLGARRSRQSRDELRLAVEARRRRPAPGHPAGVTRAGIVPAGPERQVERAPKQQLALAHRAGITAGPSSPRPVQSCASFAPPAIRSAKDARPSAASRPANARCALSPPPIGAPPCPLADRSRPRMRSRRPARSAPAQPPRPTDTAAPQTPETRGPQIRSYVPG